MAEAAEDVMVVEGTKWLLRSLQRLENYQTEFLPKDYKNRHFLEAKT
jgi:hypothetical protein